MTTETRSRRLRLWPLLGIPLAAALLFTAIVGVAHTRAGRPLMAIIGPLLGRPAAVCPLGYGAPTTPEDREQGRLEFSDSHRGRTAAAARPALGFTLERTTRAEVLAWAGQHQVACTKPKIGPDLECRGVSAELLPEGFRSLPIDTLWLTFGAGGQLLGETALRYDPSAERASAAFNGWKASVTGAAGPPTQLTGTGTAAELSSGALRQAVAEYRFSDYYALARATNMGKTYLITEDYRALAPPTVATEAQRAAQAAVP